MRVVVITVLIILCFNICFVQGEEYIDSASLTRTDPKELDREKRGQYPMYCRCGIYRANRKNKECCGRSGGQFFERMGVQPCQVYDNQMKNNFSSCCSSEYGRIADCYK